jgi:hypothetical protein
MLEYYSLACCLINSRLYGLYSTQYKLSKHPQASCTYWDSFVTILRFRPWGKSHTKRHDRVLFIPSYDV